MSLKLRFKRFGTNKKPFYRLVAMEESFPRDGKVVAELGYYDPKTNPKTINFVKDAIQGWLKKGAIPTDPVRRILGEIGIMEKLVIKGPKRGEKKKSKEEKIEEKGPEPASKAETVTNEEKVTEPR